MIRPDQVLNGICCTLNKHSLVSILFHVFSQVYANVFCFVKDTRCYMELGWNLLLHQNGQCVTNKSIVYHFLNSAPILTSGLTFLEF